ncbi:OLC1v1004594C2 [Oldenlandia corymbosa var. corymbosa]|nr:OLC1v1004594C2 [Oldenlandia corymbosa var. corymbosa]
MYYDDLPVWGFIGKVERDSAGMGPSYYLFKNIQFNILHNNNQIIEIHAFCDPNISEDITNDVAMEIKFTYSVSWKETSTPFKSRMNRYSEASLLPALRKIHWFSFSNSLVIILLTGYISFLIMKKVKNDSRRHSGGEEEEDKEVGWRNTHRDVFACPSKKTLFSAVLGTGSQLLILVVVLFALSFMGILYPYSRGSLPTSLVLVFALTSLVAGYISASFYCQFVETGLVRCVLLAGMLFLGPVLFIIFILNLVAAYIGATAALPFRTIVVVTLVHTLLGIPFLAVGGLLGYSFRSAFVAPYPKKSQKEVLSLPWYLRTPGQMFIGGLLAFSVIISELHQLYASIWGYKIYTVPIILFITFISLIMVTAISSVSLTYFQLKVEDSKWWWRSVLRGGSVAIFMFLYSIYFYAKSNMNGSFQAAFYFGYNACLCFAFFLMLGTVSFYASLMFVRRMYPAVKSE